MVISPVVSTSVSVGVWCKKEASFLHQTHQLLSHDLTNVIYEVVTVQGGGR